MSTIFEILRNAPLFKGVAYATLVEIEKFCVVKEYDENCEIIKDGEHGNILFILKSGTVSVIKKLTLLDEDRYSLKDKELILLNAEENGFFGEMVLCSETDIRSATVRTNSMCEVVEVKSADIHKVFDEHPSCGTIFYRNLSSLLAGRLRKSNRDIVKLTTALTLALED